MKKLLFVVLVIMMLGITSAVFAGTTAIDIVNGDFETPVLAADGGGALLVSPWSANVGPWAPIQRFWWTANMNSPDAPNGYNIVVMDSGNSSPVNIAQTTTATMTEGNTYTLSAYLGKPTYSTTGPVRNYWMSLIGDGSALATISNSDATGPELVNREWVFASLTYTATAADAGKTLGLKIEAWDMLSNTGPVYVDAVSLTETTPEEPVVPEPGSLLTLGAGLIGAASMVIRKRG